MLLGGVLDWMEEKEGVDVSVVVVVVEEEEEEEKEAMGRICWAMMVEDRRRKEKKKEEDVRHSWIRCRRRPSGMLQDRSTRGRCRTAERERIGD